MTTQEQVAFSALRRRSEAAFIRPPQNPPSLPAAAAAAEDAALHDRDLRATPVSVRALTHTRTNVKCYFFVCLFVCSPPPPPRPTVTHRRARTSTQSRFMATAAIIRAATFSFHANIEITAPQRRVKTPQLPARHQTTVSCENKGRDKERELSTSV